MMERRLTTQEAATTGTETERSPNTPPRAALVLPAAGRARRFGSGENKIWARLAGRTVLEWTLSAFQAHPQIETIVLVVGVEERDRAAEIARSFPKVAQIVPGGETRAESVKNGLDALPAEIEI